MNVAGTQVGLAIMIVILALGLETIVSVVGNIFEYIKLLGALYLTWLGIQLLRSNGMINNPSNLLIPDRSLNSYFWQGVFVIWSNPKALFFFGAFIPQFIDPAKNTALQTLFLGGIFMALGIMLDSLYAITTAKTASLFKSSNIRFVERISGAALIGGGVWLAFSKKT